MRHLALLLLIGLVLSSCSSSKLSRAERTYSAYLKQANATRAAQRKQFLNHQRAQMQAMRPSPSAPVENIEPLTIDQSQ